MSMDFLGVVFKPDKEALMITILWSAFSGNTQKVSTASRILTNNHNRQSLQASHHLQTLFSLIIYI